MERKVSTKDDHLVAGVLVIVRLEGQHWLGLVLAQPESLRVEREVREGNVDDDNCESVDDEDDSFHADNQKRRAVLVTMVVILMITIRTFRLREVREKGRCWRRLPQTSRTCSS